ncbi:ribokinase [Candidatus Sumerlaeota bacterium]|nr:ribokinase [Candidatus Sumerlaeota bacterium]
MDIVCRVHRRPEPGETVLGGEALFIPGGKGANQAVAAARLGGNVHFLGRVGNDAFGSQLLKGLRENQVQAECVKITDGVSSGCALILVDDKGENSIVVAPGANHRLTPEDIRETETLIAKAGYVLLQLEIPLETAIEAVSICRRHGVFTILDPAPAPLGGLPDSLFRVDLLTPNQSEAESILGMEAGDIMTTGARLLEKGAGCVVLKRGAEGAMVFQGKNALPVESFRVDAKDTTAAGDAFTAALAVALNEGMEMKKAARFACAAGALCCTRLGAQSSLPFRNDVDRFC